MEKKYFTEEERKAANREKVRRWREKNPDYGKQYYQDNKEKEQKRCKKYGKTPMGRATILLRNYRKDDKKHNRGECTIPNAQWIMENIFPKPCHWCGETGWEIMGCDRIDNELPHTPDNVNPCCKACNDKRGTMSYETFKKSLRAEETVL